MVDNAQKLWSKAVNGACGVEWRALFSWSINDKLSESSKSKGTTEGIVHENQITQDSCNQLENIVVR